MPVALACPDKFRGTLTAATAAEAMRRGLVRAGFDTVRAVPLADGGDGTLDTLLAAVGGSVRTTRVCGPLGDEVEAEWAVLPDGTAVVESARASGLALLGGRANDPLAATSRGTGDAIAAAIRSGARRVIVAVGGSAMTDGGLAAVDALGWSLKGVDVVVACDVDVPFVDAARLFGPQKGAASAQVSLLTRRLERLVDVYRARTGVDISELAHGGAAGGLAGGLAALGARLEGGFEVVATAVGLEEAMVDVSLVLTGEGRFDRSSLVGKVPGSVLDWAAAEGVSWRAVIAGQVAADVDPADLDPFGDDILVLSLTDRVWSAGEAYARAEILVEEAAVEAGRWALERL